MLVYEYLHYFALASLCLQIVVVAKGRTELFIAMISSYTWICSVGTRIIVDVVISKAHLCCASAPL